MEINTKPNINKRTKQRNNTDSGQSWLQSEIARIEAKECLENDDDVCKVKFMGKYDVN